MARRETVNKNELIIQDNISGSELAIYYRQPTTKERQTYINKRTVVKGKKLVDNSVQVRVDFGKKILTGLRDGDFERLVDDDYKPISTEKNSQNYYEDWPEWMETHCDDVLTALAIRVFEAPVSVGSSVSDNDGDEDDEEDLGK